MISACNRRRERGMRTTAPGLGDGVVHRELEAPEGPRLEADCQRVLAVAQRRDVGADGTTIRSGSPSGWAARYGSGRQHPSIRQRKAEDTHRHVVTIDRDPQSPTSSASLNRFSMEKATPEGVLQAAQGVQFLQQQARNEHRKTFSARLMCGRGGAL